MGQNMTDDTFKCRDIIPRGDVTTFIVHRRQHAALFHATS